MKKSSRKTAEADPFLSLTWTDLQEWAGAKVVSRGKAYQRSGEVEILGITPENELVAWVQGTSRYATPVSCRNGELSSRCTCPYGSNCEHAVAGVIDYLLAVKKGKTIPQVPEDDSRLRMIREGITAWPEDAEEDWEDAAEEEHDVKTSQRAGDLETYLKGKSKAELRKMLIEVVKNHPQIEMEILSNPQLSPPSTARLAQMISNKIDQVSREPAWSSHWSNDGHIPDFSRCERVCRRCSTPANLMRSSISAKRYISRALNRSTRAMTRGRRSTKSGGRWRSFTKP